MSQNYSLLSKWFLTCILVTVTKRKETLIHTHLLTIAERREAAVRHRYIHDTSTLSGIFCKCHSQREHGADGVQGRRGCRGKGCGGMEGMER